MLGTVRHDDDALRLVQAVQDLSLARDIETVVDIVKRTARELSGADGVTFVLKQGQYCHYVDEDAISPLWKGKRFPLDSCISGWAMTHREVAAIEDVFADPRIPHDVYRPTFVKSLVMTPVRMRDPIAAIGAYWAREHRASEREQTLLQSLANATAVAIENVQLIQALEQKAAESLQHYERLKAEVSRREKVEEQLRHAQKMEAVGRLASGVAHDFNNVLSVILSISTLLLAELREDDPLEPDLADIREAGRRAAELTRRLLAFSRQQVLEPKVIDLNHVIAGTESMLRRILGATVQLNLLPSASLGRVKADPASIEQVVMNLVVNARDAMPNGGKLTIETRNVELNDEYTESHHDIAPGPYVMFAVTDTGVGFDKNTRERIFEPFFTTKQQGKGTGLGLSTVFGIVKQSDGHIWVYSEPGKGTTFKVYLPRVDEALAGKGGSVPPPSSERETGTETILLVEDDEPLRNVTRNILRRSGYRVLEASNAGEALLVCEQHEATIHLLLTDLVLPKMSGRRLAERLAAVRPKMKTLYMSGYADEAVFQGGMLESGAMFLQKPITPDKLRRKVRAVLDASS